VVGSSSHGRVDQRVPYGGPPSRLLLFLAGSLLPPCLPPLASMHCNLAALPTPRLFITTTCAACAAVLHHRNPPLAAPWFFITATSVLHLARLQCINDAFSRRDLPTSGTAPLAHASLDGLLLVRAGLPRTLTFSHLQLQAALVLKPRELGRRHFNCYTHGSLYTKRDNLCARASGPD
jgi:hypothetical protein